MFQLHVSIYVSITSISTKGIILFHNYKLVSRVGFTSNSSSSTNNLLIVLSINIALLELDYYSPLLILATVATVGAAAIASQETFCLSNSYSTACVNLVVLVIRP